MQERAHAAHDRDTIRVATENAQQGKEGRTIAGAKTQPTAMSLHEFLTQSIDPARRADCRAIVAMTQAATSSAPVMWGKIVGFERYPYQYASGRTSERSVVGFVPRKSDLTLYIMPAFGGMDTQLTQFGKHKIGKSVRYIKRLEDVYMTC